MDNAVRDGLAASLARPGANLTGISVLGTEADAKRFELIREMVPNLRRLDVLFDATEPSAVTDVKELSTLARSVGVTVRALGVSNLEEIQAALKTIERDRPEALIVFDNALTEQYIDAIMHFAAHRLPTISEGKDWAKAGALLTYAPDYHNMWRRGATYVDKILKGANPGDLPIEQPTKFELVVNLKTAKALGLTIPQSILLRADGVIK
jgi:putative ABC transport system substrate-binding protein